MPKYDDNDFMELGDSHLVPQGEGWFYNTKTGQRISPNGQVFDKEGEPDLDPVDDEDFRGSDGFEITEG